MASVHFSKIQLKGLVKLGDVIIPGDKDLPRFSETGLEAHVDRLVNYMNKDDLDGLKIVLFLFAFTPSFLISKIIEFTEGAEGEGFLATNMRLANIGFKGIIFTLYYSKLDPVGERIIKTIKWDSKIASIPEGEDEMEQYTDSAKNNIEGSDAKTIRARSRKAEEELALLDVDARLNFIDSLIDVILKKREWIIDSIQKDNGKSRTDALVSEIFGVLDNLHWLKKTTKKAIQDEKVHTPIALLGKKSRIYYSPLGTILVISPWNYPFFQAIVPIATAFATGNAVIYKPSEFTPLEGVVEKLLSEAGFKKDWVQVVYGDGKVGSDLIDTRPDKIFFTGSVATGKKIMAQASEQLIPVELELGGKDPMVVFEDANIERAVRGCLWGALTCTGQSCTSVEQVYVHEDIYPQFKELLLSEVKKIRQGTDSNGEGEIGLMTTDAQVKIVADHLEDAVSKGAKLLHGGEWDKASRAIPPLVLEDMNDEMKMTNEETFGPIVPLVPFSSEQDMIEKINQSDYGLSASVWSKDIKRCERVARAIKTGNVSINNVMLTEGNPALPFGGVKNSGIGRYKGVSGLRGFCNSKSILIDADSAKCEVNWFPYTKKKYDTFDKMTVALFTGGILNFIKFALTGLGLEMYSDKIAKKK